jgi:hypothetical protein
MSTRLYLLQIIQTFPEFPGDFIWYDINVGNISIKSGDASNNSLATNISF